MWPQEGRLRGGGQGPKVRRSQEGHLCGPSGPREGHGRVMGGRDAGTTPSGLDPFCRSLQPGTRRSQSVLLGVSISDILLPLSCLQKPLQVKGQIGFWWEGDWMSVMLLMNKFMTFFIPHTLGEGQDSFGLLHLDQNLPAALAASGPPLCSESEVRSPVLTSCPNAQGCVH